MNEMSPSIKGLKIQVWLHWNELKSVAIIVAAGFKNKNKLPKRSRKITKRLTSLVV